MQRFILIAVICLPVGCNKSPSPMSPPTLAPADTTVPFVDVASETGLVFGHFIGAAGGYYMPEVMGAGIALFDYDLDGDLDVYLLQGQMLGAHDLSDSLFPPPDSHWPGNRLYRNELVPDGKLAFTDVTVDSGLGYQGYGMGAAVGDIDNDGDPDLYLTLYGSNVLFRNDGDGSFTDITATAGVDDERWSTAAGFHDYDRDGDLDLFVVNYVAFDLKRNTECTSPGGRRDYCGPQVYPPLTDRLFRNDGSGHFADISTKSGIAGAAGPGLGLVWADFNGDGWTDVYVANDGAANYLWLNQAGQRFVDAGVMSGTAYNSMGSPEASMGVTAGDFDGDGDEDLFMTHLIRESNTLYINNGRAGFVDATDQYRLGQDSKSLTGFGSMWFDYDNDSDLDLFVANGNVKLEETRVGVSQYPFEQRNQLFRNEAGTHFTEVGRNSDVFEILTVSRGAAFGDIDNDGDIDIVVSNNNGPVQLLRNDLPVPVHWLRVRLIGTQSNRDGTGARLAVIREHTPPLWRRAHTDGSYLSASDSRVHIGLGTNTSPVDIGVIWPTGGREIWRNVAIDAEITLTEGSSENWLD